MNLENKKVFFLGDSITEGEGTSSSEHCYVSVFEQLSKACVKNYSVNGMRIAKQKVTSNGENAVQDFVSKVDEMKDDADVVVVFGGTNDFGHSAAIGSMESRSEYTFYGAMHMLCNKLIKKYPKAEIVFITPLHRIGEDEARQECGLNQEVRLSDYVRIIREVTEYYSLPLLDLFRMGGLQPNIDIIRELYMPDGLHPSDAGAEKIAEKIYHFLINL